MNTTTKKLLIFGGIVAVIIIFIALKKKQDEEKETEKADDETQPMAQYTASVVESSIVPPTLPDPAPEVQDPSRFPVKPAVFTPIVDGTSVQPETTKGNVFFFDGMKC